MGFCRSTRENSQSNQGGEIAAMNQNDYKFALANQDDPNLEKFIKRIQTQERERCASIVKSYSSIVGSFIDPINILVKTLINEIEKSIREQG